jgi:hypothetical protein
MSGVSFTAQIKKEFNGVKKDLSNKVTRAAILAWKEAVKYTPVLTGNLRAGWRLSTVRRSSYVPAPGIKGHPPTPAFKFRVGIDRRVYLYNNVPYASFVENGEGPGVRVPRLMMQKAINKFNSEVNRTVK